jgi:hypothetical protein
MSVMMEIPVKPWMHKYLAREYGNPYVLDCREPLSTLLYANLHRKKELSPELDYTSGLTERFKISIGKRLVINHSLVDIPYKNKVALRDRLEEQFFDRLYEYTISQQQIKLRFSHIAEIKKSLTVDASIEQFLSRYGITDEEYDLQSVKRRYRMVKDRKTQPLAVTVV